MKSPDFEVKTTVSGDFNNHKTKYKAINSAGYIFSGTTIYQVGNRQNPPEMFLDF